MVLDFNVTKESRKAMVYAIEKELGAKAKYKGVPSCAYEIGGYRVGKEGELEWAGIDGATGHTEQDARVVKACITATGIIPAGWMEDEGEAGETNDTEPAKVAELTVTLPADKANTENLAGLLEAKGGLIKEALGIDELRFEIHGGSISFPWFSEIGPDEIQTFTRFIGALCEMTLKQKRITAKPKENENKKYAFRCFLLRLGFIGDEYKKNRKILLSKLEGSSAFKSGKRKGGER